MPRWIDVRQEDRALIYGDSRTKSQGFWVVLRLYRIGQYSKYWNPATGEAVGGPKYLYDDFIVRVIDKPGAGNGSAQSMTGTGETPILASGMDDFNTRTYAILPDEKLTRLPQIGDTVYEIDKADSEHKPTPPLVATDRFNISNHYYARGDHGRVELIYLVGKRIHGES